MADPSDKDFRRDESKVSRYQGSTSENSERLKSGKRYEDLDKLLSEKMPVKAKASAAGGSSPNFNAGLLSDESRRKLGNLRDLMRDAIYMKKTDLPDLTLQKLRQVTCIYRRPTLIMCRCQVSCSPGNCSLLFLITIHGDWIMALRSHLLSMQEYLNLDWRNRQMALVVLATQFGVDRQRVLSLLKHYTALSLDDAGSNDGGEAALLRTEHDLRLALTPISGRLFEQMNGQAGGLKFLVDLRADLLSTLREQNMAALRAVDTELKGLFATWLGPACLELKHITWENSAALLEKIVEYEAVHPISNLYDLKRRLGIGRRCYGYFHPAIPGEPLVFIEVALSSDVLGSIQDVLFEKPPVSEVDASIAVFYSISSTQPGLAGIDLGNFLIKRVVRLLVQEMPNIQTFVTLSPVPGFTKWLLPKLELQMSYFKSDLKNKNDNVDSVTPTTFKEDFLLSEEESSLMNVYSEGKSKDSVNAIEILLDLLKSPGQEWAKSTRLADALNPILLRLCARYLLQEKQRGRALDPVTNFHVRNGATVERLNWMGDTSPNGLRSSAGIMVNYMYRLENIEANNQAYVSDGVIAVSPAVERYLKSRL